MSLGDQLLGTVLDSWEIEKKIGHGGMSRIYAVQNLSKDQDKECVAKVSQGCQIEHLQNEFQVYQELHKHENIVGVPKIMGMYVQKDLCAMIVEKLGYSLYALLKAMRKFSKKTVLMIGHQAVNRIEIVHQCRYVHRDIKPTNILTGLRSQVGTLYLIDFGIAQRYISRFQKHLPNEESCFAGTITFASCSAMEENQVSRKDDLISLAYTLVYLATGSLPWSGLKDPMEVYKLKKETNVDQLCDHLPKALKSIFIHAHALKFDQAPNYRWMQQCFIKSLTWIGEKNDNCFDWVRKVRSSKNDCINKIPTLEAR